MKKSTIFYGIVGFFAVVLPILGMMNCSGWNEGSMVVSSCVIDHTFLRSYANFYYSWLVLSAFMLGLPLLLYGLVIALLARLAAKKFIKE